jgi:hypothetical protein
MQFKMKNYKCERCGKVSRVWVESECYKKKLCARCLDEEGVKKGGES